MKKPQPPVEPPTAPPANPIPPKPKPDDVCQYLRDVGDVVQTGAVRAGDENADFYTVPLTQKALIRARYMAAPTATC